MLLPQALMIQPYSPHVPLLRFMPWAQVMQLVEDAHAVQLAGQLAQMPLVATVLAGHKATGQEESGTISIGFQYQAIIFDPAAA